MQQHNFQNAVKSFYPTSNSTSPNLFLSQEKTQCLQTIFISSKKFNLATPQKKGRFMIRALFKHFNKHFHIYLQMPLQPPWKLSPEKSKGPSRPAVE